MQQRDARDETHGDADYSTFVLDAFRAAPFELDLRTHTLHPSPRLNALFGYPADHMLTLLDCQTRVHFDDLDLTPASFSRARVVGDEPFRSKGRILRPGDGARWVLFHGKVIADDAGQPARLRGAFVDITEQESHEHYRTLLDTIHQGFCRFEMLYNAQGIPVDYRFLEVNQTFERHTGLRNVVGKTARELVADLEPFWFVTYGRVAATGETLRFEQGSAAMGRIFEVEALRFGPVGRHEVALIFTDVTERKRTEAQLAAAAARDQYRVRLSDALRPLSSAVAIEGTAVQVLGEQLGASRVAYFEVLGTDYVVERDYVAGTAPIAGRYPIASFGPKLLAAYQAGRPVVESDSEADPDLAPDERAAFAALQIGAYIGVPLLKEGTFVAGLAVHQATPRAWTPNEVTIVQETTEQTWAAVERARAEAALHESEEKYRALTELSSHLVWMLAGDGSVSYLSQQWYDYTGIPVETIQTHGWLDVLHPDDREQISADFARYLAEGAEYSMEMRLQGKDGRYRWHLSRATPIVDTTDMALRWFGVSFDIDDHKRAEEALRESKERHAYLLTLSDVLRPLADPVAIESKACRLLGERLGVDRAYYVEVNEDEQYIHVDQDYLRGDSPSLVGTYRLAEYGWSVPLLQRGETMVTANVQNADSIPHADRGTMAMINIAACVMVPLLKAGRLVGALCVTEREPRTWSKTEIELVQETAERIWATIERARAEEALRESEARLQQLYIQEQTARAAAEEASRLKDEFLATVSHELRTPLTAFLGYGELLKRRKRDEAYVTRTIEKMVQSAKSQAALIEDLLDISRVVSGKLRIDAAPLDLSDVVYAALDTIRPAAEAKHLQVEVDLSETRSIVLGDANRLQQVVWNLLSNATKFTPPGGRIMVRLVRAGSNVELHVRDTGEGIRTDFLPYVFDRFRQADSSSQRTYSGLGLGLAIVRHLVELHGGAVMATSDGVGQGATFTVWLPLVDAYNPGQRGSEAATDDATPAEGGLSLSGMRILVVDDQPAIGELLEEVLVAEGAVVRVCISAPEALDLLRAWQPDVLLSDIAMPHQDGYWLIEQVRSLAGAEGGAIPAVALTAYVRIEDRLRVLAAGFQQYVPKPVDAAELIHVIADLVQRG